MRAEDVTQEECAEKGWPWCEIHHRPVYNGTRPCFRLSHPDGNWCIGCGTDTDDKNSELCILCFTYIENARRKAEENRTIGVGDDHE